ncbi:hypothetical protein [Glutamicibacter sp.]|nr:hypothetical protein [Glutamicibacter sp.]
MTSVQTTSQQTEALSPEAQAIKDRCIAEAGAVLANIFASRAAGESVAA